MQLTTSIHGGFHEGRLDGESIEMRLPIIEKLLKDLEELMEE